MEKLTYQQAYDKIIQAYFKDEIRPMKSRFCFCGTLSPDQNWRCSRHYPYSADEYNKMEDALFYSLVRLHDDGHLWEEQPDYEESLFAGMCAALEVLKQIHKERGEDVDGVPEFTKRKLISDSSCVASEQ